MIHVPIHGLRQWAVHLLPSLHLDKLDLTILSPLPTSCAPSFRAMFSSGFQEANQREIVVRDWSHAVFLLMMEYLYTGKEPPGLSKYVPTPLNLLG